MNAKRAIERAGISAVVITVIVMAMIALSAVSVHAASGASIKEPADQAKFELGKTVTIKANAGYDRPAGTLLLKPNYVYYRVTSNGTTVLYGSNDYTFQHEILTLDKSFVPDHEGTYQIEVCRDLTYENGEHVDLAEEDFVAEDSITIIVQKDISKAETSVEGVGNKVYTGQELTQEPAVIVDGKTLDPETDYDLTYANNTNVGTARMTITGKGFYKGSISRDFEITQADITKAGVAGITAADYNGSAVTQEPVVTWNGRTLVEDTDYELAYENNTNAGTAQMTITGKGNFTGEIPKTFTIRQASIRNATLSGLQDKTYSGSAQTQNLTLSYLSKTLVKDTDYTVSYKNNTQPGTATVTIAGKGNFKDSLIRTFSILEQSGSSQNWGTTILTPAADAQYQVGNKIKVKVKAGVYQNAWYHGSDLHAPNYIYVKITRNGEKVFYDWFPYYSGNMQIETDEITLSQKGDYEIRTGRDGFYFDEVENENGGFTLKYRDIAYEDFVGDQKITVHVGTSAPAAKKDISKATVTNITDKQYTGNAITQSPVVKLDGKTLVNGTDYYVTYNVGSANVNVGPVIVTIHGKGNYTGEYNTHFNITPRTITESMITLSPESFTYNGTLQKPSVTVKNGDVWLAQGKDYALTNEGGTAAGDYTVTVSAATNGNYTGTAAKTYQIKKQPISSAVVTATPASYIYDGSAKEPAVTVTLDGQELAADLYTAAYNNNTKAGTASVIVTAAADSNYTGSASGTFEIGQADIANGPVMVAPIDDLTYNRKAQAPVPEITFGEQPLSEGTDFTLSYEDNTDAGTASVTINGKGDFKGSRSVNFRIMRKDLSDGTITVDPIPYQLYTEGVPAAPQVTVRDGDDVLGEEEIAVFYNNNSGPGTGSVTITGIGNYTGSIETVEFEILDRAAFAETSLRDRIAGIEEMLEQYLAADQKALNAAVEAAKGVLNDSGSTVEQLEQTCEDLKTLQETAEENLKQAQEHASVMPAAADTEQQILSQKTDRDPAGSRIAPLLLKSTKQSKKYNVLTWKKVPGATSYVVYGNKCGKSSRIKKLATVKGSTFTHKRLKKGTYYKYVVVAVKDTVIGERTAAVSKMIHVSTKGGKAGNYKKIVVSKTVIKKAKALKAGKSLKIGAKALKTQKKVAAHAKLRYESSNAAIAKVSSKGVIKGVRKGTCYVYIYTQNGVSKRITVKVK